MTRLMLGVAAAALAAAAALGGCTTVPTVAASCHEELAADLPLRTMGGFPVVPVRLDGDPVEFMVDTGFARSLVTPAAAGRLGLADGPGRATRIGGAGGTTMAAIAEVPRLQIGTIAAEKADMLVAPLPQPGPTVSGVLGDDWLARFDVDIDLPRGHFALWRVQGCDAGHDPLEAPHFAVPMRRLRDGFIVVPVGLDGARIGALLDSGDRFTSVLPAAAAYVGVPAVELSGTGVGVALGMDRNPLPIRLHRFAEFRIGTETFHGIVMPIVGVQVPLVGMLIGANYLEHHRVWISNATGRLLIVPVP